MNFTESLQPPRWHKPLSRNIPKLKAAKKGDKLAHDEAAKELEAAGQLLEESSKELEQG